MNKPRLAQPHYQSDAPCKKCKGRLRYTTTRGCVPCAKAAVRKRRGTIDISAAVLAAMNAVANADATDATAAPPPNQPSADSQTAAPLFAPAYPAESFEDLL